MKLKQGYVIKNIASNYMIVKSDDKMIHFNEIISLNELGYEILTGLLKNESKSECIARIMNNYEVSKDEISNDYDTFLISLSENDLIENENN